MKRRAFSRIAAVAAVLGTVLLEVPAANAAFPGTNGKIVFSSNRDEPNPSGCSSTICNFEIYTINPDGTGLTRLTFNSARDQDPQWSPDGNKIVFSRRAAGQRAEDIWVMNADGTSQTNLTNGADPITHLDPAWSPDQTKIAFGDGDENLWTMNSDGTGAAQLAFVTFGEDWSWSPDGSSIAFGEGTGTGDGNGTDIAVIGADGTGSHHLYDGLSVGNPDWSPDGTKIAFHGSPFDPGPDFGYRIRVMNRDGSNPHSVSGTAGVSTRPAWSPDGSKIVFQQGSGSGVDGGLAVVNGDGTGQTAITSTVSPITDNGPDWQPIPVKGFPRPKSATPTRISLVPAYKPCTASNRTHGPPLGFASCSPPQQASDYLTVGTSDANGKSANSVGYVRYGWVGEIPINPNNGNQADVTFNVSVTDVRKKSDLTDYTGELRATTALRITDKNNTPNPGGPGPGTVTDTTLGVTVPCASTPSATIGSSCALSTTENALLPGAVIEGKRGVWQLGQVQVFDGGSDGDADTAGDNTLFEVEGVFIP